MMWSRQNFTIMNSKTPKNNKSHRARLFNPDHLHEVEESYFIHLQFGIWAGAWLMMTGVVSIVHAVIPVFMARVPDRMFRYFVAKSSTRIKRIETLLRKKNLG
jgi:hypothetical protein